MKNILLIATGGTIASKPDNGRLTPEITSSELIAFAPEIANICNVTALQPFNRDSTNMTYDDWFALSNLINDNYAKYDGFVVTHGTDTMAYAAAALSYFVQNNAKPIVLTGSQKSIYLRDTDARANLIDAFTFACNDNAHLTHVVFDGKAILGTRARKLRTKSFNAFASIDYPEVARIIGGKVRTFIKTEVEGEPIFCKKIVPSVAAIKLIPGMSADLIDYLIDKCSAVVIESFGVGGIPYYSDTRYEDAIKRLRDSGVQVIMTTQVMHEGSDMAVYKVGEVMEKLGLIEARDMTVEAIVAKTVWALGIKEKPFKELFLTPVGADILG